MRMLIRGLKLNLYQLMAIVPGAYALLHGGVARGGRAFPTLRLAIALAVGGLAGSASVAHAQAEPVAAPLAMDVELDPLAYILGGFSVHAGLRPGDYRLDVGAYALQMPRFVHGASGVDAYMSGFGLKLDRRVRIGATELFFGVQVGTARLDLRVPDSGGSDVQRVFDVGLRLGWEIPLLAGFYIAPWLGVGAVLGGHDRQFSSPSATRSWDALPHSIFPTVHLGWKANLVR